MVYELLESKSCTDNRLLCHILTYRKSNIHFHTKCLSQMSLLVSYVQSWEEHIPRCLPFGFS